MSTSHAKRQDEPPTDQGSTHSSNSAHLLTVAQCLEQVLVDNGIEIAATIPGGPLTPLLQAIHDKQRIVSILTRHESAAAMLADGYYRVSRRPALVAVTAGPGVTNAVTGIALAHSEHTPMVILSAQVSTSWYGRGAAQELDTVRLLEPITKCSMSLKHPARAAASLQYLISLATSGRGGPVHLSVPADLWTRPTAPPPIQSHRPVLAGPRPHRFPSICNNDSIAALRERITRAHAPCVLVGNGAVASGALAELLELAEHFPQLRFACTPRAKGAFPESHPQSLGVFGFAGHPSAERGLLDSSDLVVVLGSRLGEIASLCWDTRFKHVALAQVDIEPSELGKNFPIELGIAADIAFVLRQLVSGVPRPLAPSTQPPIAECVDPAAEPSTAGIHPGRLMHLLNLELSGDEHVFVDIGNTMAWALHYLRRDTPARWHINLMFGCMGHSLPAALGGALAARRPVVALVGDAALAMSGLELHTAVENDLPVVVLALNDGGHGMVVMGSEHQYGPDAVPNARFGRRLELSELAQSVGAIGVKITSEAELVRQLNAALASKRPTLLDVVIDATAIPPFGSRMTALAKNFRADSGELR